KNKVVTIKADSCSGEIPAYSNTYYCIFCLGYEDDGTLRRPKQVARVAKSRLLPGYYEVYQKLFGRPWLDKVRKADKIVLSEYRDYESRLSGWPDDTVSVWEVNYSDDMWVIVAGDKKKTRAILHIMNNPEITRRGKTGQEAIRKLFPGKKVFLLEPTTVTVEL